MCPVAQKIEDELLDEFDHNLAAEDDEETEELGITPYIADPRSVWAAEGTRAILVALTKRLGPEFARDVHDALAARTFSYEAGCPDDRRDAEVLNALLADRFWDPLLALPHAEGRD